MKLGIQFRLAALASAVVVVGVLMAWATLRSQLLSEQLREQLDQVDSEGFQIADRFRHTLRELDSKLFAYGLVHNPADWEAFLVGSRELDAWIDRQKPHLETNRREKELLQQIDRAYDDYNTVVKNLQGKVQAAGQQNTTLADYKDILTQSQRLFDLGQKLSDAHYARRDQLLLAARSASQHLRWLQFGLLGALFFAGLALAVFVYRDMIAPLRLKLVQSQEVVERQEKLASLGMLAAGVAHEIRNPLTAIKAAVFIHQRKAIPGSQDYEDAELMQREISRLERIVEDFLEFARPSEPQLANLPAEQPLQEVRQLLGGILGNAKIQLAVEADAALRIRADSAQIKQVLINLVQNAADSIGQEGLITLRARSDYKRLSGRETEVVVIEVVDTGKGIPPEVEKRLFDPFFTTKDNGTGLGLPIAAGIVQKHGGRLQYLTQLNTGTTFGIILPRATE